MATYKAIKKSILGYLILCGLLALSGTLQAATPPNNTQPALHHKPPTKPIQPVTTQNQLHIAVQLHFPTDTIKLLLTSPKVAINALDSSGKTPLDYATQGGNLYQFLVGYNAQTSQQLTQSQAPLPLPVTAPLASHLNQKSQKEAHKVSPSAPLPPDQLLIPANGQCLYTTVIMGYLLPVRESADKLTTRIDELFGLQPAYYLNELHQTLQTPTHYLTYLHSDSFSTLASAFMARMQIKKGTWGGPEEIQTIATKLKINIQAYYPDPSNPTNLVESDLTKSAQTNSEITLHIVRDKVHPAEVLTQAEKASAKDNPHYQHYRLKYTLPLASPAAMWTGTHPDIPTQILAPTRPVKTPTSIVPSDIHPLKKLLDTPHQIAWQGWVAMAAYGETLQETYAIVTIAGTLYILRKRPNPYSPKAIPSVARTIQLEDYGFVLNIDVHKPTSFLLAQVNPANSTLTAYNTFALDTPTTDTLADELISYVMENKEHTENKVDVIQINRFLDWLIAEEMDEEALIADIMDNDAPATQSNIYQHFPVLYKLIGECLPKIHQDKIHPNALIGQDPEGLPIANPLLYALRTIPHHYVYIDTQGKQAAICALGLTTTLGKDKHKAKAKPKATQNIPKPLTAATAPPQRQQERHPNPLHRRPLRSYRGWAGHPASDIQREIAINTTGYHLVPLIYHIAGDHTATTTCYCLVPPRYTTTYQKLTQLLTTHQGMAVQQLTYVHNDKALQDKADKIDWHIARQKSFQVYFDLVPHFLQHPDRILWQGWAYLGLYGTTGKQSYCLITDDEKLYTFEEKPDFERQSDAKPHYTIDLAHYSFVDSDPNDPNRLILSKINSAWQQLTATNTFTCYMAEPKLLPTATEDKAIPPIYNDTLLHTLRRATHQYHYITTIDKQPTLCPFDQAAPLDSNTYRLVQISCQTEAYHTPTHLYCLLPRDYQPTYQAFAQLWQAYCHTTLLQLTHHNQQTPLEANQTHIHWETKANKAFAITLPATLPKKALCRLVQSEDLASSALGKGKSQQTPPQKQTGKNAQKGPLRIGERSASPEEADLFAYEAKFAKMNRLALWALYPLQQLQDPRLRLKNLLMEVIENGCAADFGKVTHSTIKMVKYITLAECPWLATVADKMDHGTHCALGKPLNIAEMAAIKLYTDSTYSYPDLGWAQRTGHLHKWQVWDQLLMTALLKLHLAELHHHQKHQYNTYSGLADIAFNVKEKIGFFKTYVSTSTDESTALRFVRKAGMVMYVSPEMQQQFINGDVAWISKYGIQEKEILFARSADIAGFPALKWKATVQGYHRWMKDVQKVNFSPAAAPLIIPKGTTYILSAQAMPYAFSYIKIEEEATLTITPWQRNQPNGGHLAIRCYGDCMLGKNAKITVSAKGYSGGKSLQCDGYGPRGGATGTYCAAGGSNSTAGESGHCRDAFDEATTYHASSPVAYGQVILTKDSLTCGSGGGYLHYPDNRDTGSELSTGANGAPGGGALYLEIDGQLQLAEHSAFLANGGEVTPLTGGAGSGGTICLALKGAVTFTNDKATLRINAQGGHHQKAIAPRAQGAGGAGHITLYMHQYNQEALKRFVTQPPALVLRRRQVEQRKNYKDTLVDHYLITQGIPFANVKSFWQWLEREEMEEDAIMADMAAATPSQSNIYLFDEAIFGVLQHFMATLAPQQLPSTITATPLVSTAIPDHVTMVTTYYNAQGKDHTEKAAYPQAALYHKAALALQAKKYGEHPHPNKADTLLYCAKVAAHQGNYPQAIKDGTASLDIREKLYQVDTPAHPAIIETLTQLGWFEYQQGHPRKALQRLKATLQLWEKHHGDQQNLLLVDTYNYIGLVQQSLGQYQQAIDLYHKKAQLIAQSALEIAHSLRATTLHYMGQAQTHMGQYSRAIATHHDEMTLLEKLHGQDRPHPDKARSLRGEAVAYLTQGNPPVAMQQYRAALAHLQKTYGTQAAHPDMATALSGIARSYAALGNYHLATLFHAQAQTMYQDIYGKQAHHPAMADNLDDLGDLALQQQQRDEAMTFYQRAYEMKKKLYRAQEVHLEMALSHSNIGRVLLQALLHYEEAPAAQENILEMATAIYSTSADILLVNQVDKKKALQHYTLGAQEKALEIATAVYDEAAYIPIIGRLQREIGRVHQAMHHYRKAQIACTTSLETYKILFGDQPHPDTAHTHYALGEIYCAQKAYDQALHHMSKALTIRQALYPQVAHHPAISEALLQLGRLHAIQAEYDSAIHYYALATRCQVNHLSAMSDLGQNLARFVPTNVSLQKTLAQGEHPSPLHEKSIMPFLHDPQAQVLLLHGDAGAGKSLYGRFLEKALWHQSPPTFQAMQRAPYTVSLFINLPALQDPTQNAIAQALQQYGWDQKTIAYFKAQLQQRSAITKPHLHAQEEEKQAEVQPAQAKEKVQPLDIDASFVIILDGYDEINHLTKPLNLYAAHQLHTWHAKVVITCRTEHLESIPDYTQYFAPHGQGLVERYIRPFDAQQIEHYLDKITKKVPASADAKVSYKPSDTTAADTLNANHWTKENYHNAFAKIPSLQELIKSPFLLRLITTILPQLQTKDHSEITRTAVYTAFTDQWVKKELTRMQITGTEANQKAEEAKAYAAELGFELFFQEEQVFRTDSPDKAWQRFFAEAQALTYLALLPLRQVGPHQYQFIHKSCLEFFAAQHIDYSLAQLHERQEELKAHFAQQVIPYQPADRDVAIQDTHSYSRYATSCPPINQKLLKSEPAIIAFLQDSLWERKANSHSFTPSLLQQWLFHVIKSSRNNPKVAIAATNAIMILAPCVSLAGQAWEGIQIPDAVLDGAFLAHTNLQGANLKRVSLREAHLAGVQCQQAQVAGLQFGEYPYFIHQDHVTSVRWSHDDRFLAAASWAKSVHVWDFQTGEQVQVYKGHTHFVTSVRWSHDDRFLASASKDKSVRIWDRHRGEQVQIFRGHSSSLNSVTWSPDDRFLASASDDERVRIWDRQTGLQVQICQGHEEEVTSVCWSHDGRFLASASNDMTVRIWDATTGMQVQIFRGHEEEVTSVCWSHDDHLLASTSDDNSVRVWDHQRGEQVQICQGEFLSVNSVSWSHDDRFLAFASGDHAVRVWGRDRELQVQVFQGHKKRVTSVSWSHDDRFLASASRDNTVCVWDPKAELQVQVGQEHTFWVQSVSWSHDDRFLASASADHTVRVWDRHTGRQVQICEGHKDEVNSVTWSPDDRFLASAGVDKSVRIWNPWTGIQVQVCEGHEEEVNSVCWSHDARFLASASDDKSVRVWNPKTGVQVQIYHGHSGHVTSVSWSPDNHFLASASEDKSVRIWDQQTGEQVQVCLGHEKEVTSVSWSHNGRFLASVSKDNSVRIWNPETGMQMQICLGHTFWVQKVSWSYDDAFLASASYDKSVRIWDSTTGQQVQICLGHKEEVTSVSWSHDDLFLASASWDKSVRIWDRGIMANDESSAIRGTRAEQSEVSPEQSKDVSTPKFQEIGKCIFPKECRPLLVIGRWNGLVLKGANFSGAVGLSEINKRLITQRDGKV